MPFSGGVYSLPSLPGSFNPAVEGQNATASDWNTLAADLTANGLSMCITRNGQSTVTANLPMSGFKLTGMTAGSALGDSVVYEQVVQRSYLAGFIISNNAGTPNTVLDVAAGQAVDSTNAIVMQRSSGNINCGTTGANGLDTGSLANSTWYHAFVIAKTDGTTAFLASTSELTPTLPSGYTYKRRIASFLTDGSAHILAFTQRGDLFQWDTPIVDWNASSIASTTVQAVTVSVPGYGQATLRATWIGTIGGSNTGITGTQFSIIAYTPGKATTVPVVAGGTSGTATTSSSAATWAQIVASSTSAISVKPTYSNTLTIQIETQGWIDTRGRDV